MIKAAVLGGGNIGSGVIAVIEENQEQIRKTLPEGMEVKYVLDLREFPGTSFEHKVVHDISIIVNDPEIKVVCETMGGKEPAFTFSKMALEKGISVCSSNKELVEAHGPELIRIAKEHGCSYLFEASVGGGIPLLHPLITCLAQEEIQSIEGILNGTTNYILTKMEREGADYAATLKEAQDLGYAERNPEADVEGHDTGRKIAILASLMSTKSVRFQDEKVEGITAITPADFAYAGANGYTIKLIGMARLCGQKLRIQTAPFLIPDTHPLYAVHDVFNGVLVHGNMVDDVMFYGRGAGKLPTGSAVVSDMINAAANPGRTLEVHWDAQVLAPEPAEGYENAFFVRVPAASEKKAREAFAGSIKQVWTAQCAPEGEFAFVTDVMREDAFEEKAACCGVISRIRMLNR